MSDPWPWPMTPTGSVYCPVPAIEGFFAPFASRWTTPYPLVKIVWNRYPIPYHNDTTATLALSASLAAGTMGHIRVSDVHVNTFLQNLESLSIAFGNSSSNATTTTAAPPSLIWPGVINANFCAYGYTFILEAITGYLLSAIAMGCFIALVVRTSRHTNRKLLFFLLFTVGVTRGLFGHLAANRIGLVNSYYEMNHYIGWFFDWTIPLSMLGDLLMSYLDFLLTFFWLQFIAPRWSRSHWGTFVPVASVMLTLLISIVVFLTDWHQLHSDNEGNNDGVNIEAGSDRDDAYNGGNIYYRSLAYISSLLLVSSVLHSIVVVRLLRDLITHQAALQELSPKMRQNMTAVGVIGFLSVLSGIMRGVVLLGHISRLSIFLDGQLSFDNPEFFTVYLIGFMNMPCLAICVAFFHLSWKLISSGEMDDDDCIGSDGAYSVVDEGDGVRISLIAGRYAYRMNSSNFGGGGRHIGDSFASNGSGYGGGPTTGTDIDSSYPSESFNAGQGGAASATTSGNFGGNSSSNTSNLVAENGATPVRGSSSRGIATSAAMFAGTRGPGAGFIVSGNTPQGSRSRRELKSERVLPKANSVDETEENH